MDHKQFLSLLSERVGRSESDIEALTEGLTTVIRQSCADLDTVAVPTFGSFVPVKHNEEIVNDLSTGKRMLLPPEITLSFEPSARLRNRLSPSEPLI